MNTAAMLIGYAAIFIAAFMAIYVVISRLLDTTILIRAADIQAPISMRLKVFLGFYGPVYEETEYGLHRPDRITIEAMRKVSRNRITRSA